MIKVLFFARLREQLQCSTLEVKFDPATNTLGALQQRLMDRGGPAWEENLGAENVVRAVNQETAELDQVLADGDEVAFFPPVTGG